MSVRDHEPGVGQYLGDGLQLGVVDLRANDRDSLLMDWRMCPPGITAARGRGGSAPAPTADRAGRTAHLTAPSGRRRYGRGDHRQVPTYANALSGPMGQASRDAVIIHGPLDQHPLLERDDVESRADADLTAVLSASSALPGMAFLLATRAAFGETWGDYWHDLLDNGLKIVNGTTPRRSLHHRRPTRHYFRQVEHVGVLKGAKNPEGIHELVELCSAPRCIPRCRAPCTCPISGEVSVSQEWSANAPEPDDA
ncbi:hypothetical protein QBC39DRAFT_419156 [Podospora conica]|nr:hypothetical protein QBC39DRAFT_419156 [Schizothecium conicum]